MQLLTCARFHPPTSVAFGCKSSNKPALAISAVACSSSQRLMSSGVLVNLSRVPIILHLSCKRIRVEPVWDVPARESRSNSSSSSSSSCVAGISTRPCRGGVKCSRRNLGACRGGESKARDWRAVLRDINSCFLVSSTIEVNFFAIFRNSVNISDGIPLDGFGAGISSSSSSSSCSSPSS